MAQAEPIRILYIEDDPGLARLVQKKLQRDGYVVDIASDGEEGITKYRGDSYDILFLDQSLPVYDGLEVIRVLGSKGSLPPTIMITGTGNERVAVEAMKLGASDYIVKDVGTGYLELLPSAIEKVLQQRRAHDEKQRAEQALRESEEKYRTILEEMVEGYFEIDLKGNYTFVNDSVCKRTGYSKAELIGMNNRQYTDKTTAKKMYEIYSEVYRTGKSVELDDYELIRKDGTRYHIELSVSLKKDPSGKPIGFRGISRDITERKKMQEELRKSEERYRTVLDDIHEGYFEVDLAGKYTFVNDALCKNFRYTREELIGTKSSKHQDEANAKKTYQAFNELYRTGEPVKAVEAEFIRKDGTKEIYELSASLIRDTQGKPIGFRGTSRNITERKKMEEALQKTEEHLRIIVEGASDGFIYVDTDGIILFANKRMKEILADPHPEGKPLKAFYDEENQKILAKHLKARWEGKGTIYEIVLADAQGRRHNLLVSDTPYRDKEGNIQGAFGIYHDVTQERESARIISEHKEALKNSFFGTAEALSKVIEDRDPYTSGHSVGVAGLVEAIARVMGYPEDEITGIYIAGILHDIGKMAVPVEILVKPGRLTDMEMSLIQMHPQAGYEILKGIDFPWPVAQATLQHHERLDGSGYPLGLKGDEIIREARILAVADVVDAMTHHRPYRPAFKPRDAMEEIKKGRGTTYDPQVVDACLEVLEGKQPFVISEYSTRSTSPQLRRAPKKSSTLPTTTRMKSSGSR